MKHGNESVVSGRGGERREAASERNRADAPRVDPATHAMLREFSHDLRGRLNAINGWADVLEGRVSDELAVRALETIKRNAAAQASLIRDMLDRIGRAAEPPDDPVRGSSIEPSLRAASGARSRR